MPSFAAVAIVDDNADICAQLRQVLDGDEQTACVCVCRSMQSAMRQIPVAAPDVVLMDISLGDGSGTECARRLLQAMPGLRIVMFSVHDDECTVLEALGAGASGYLLKTAPPAEVLQAVADAAAGHARLSPPVAGTVARALAGAAAAKEDGAASSPLTAREGEVLRLCADGRAPKDIARALDISLNTVNTHLKHVYRKLDVRSRIEAVIRHLGRRG